MNTRYDMLDGLRGVAAVSVLVYHPFEAIAFADGATEQQFYMVSLPSTFLSSFLVLSWAMLMTSV